MLQCDHHSIPYIVYFVCCCYHFQVVIIWTTLFCWLLSVLCVKCRLTTHAKTLVVSWHACTNKSPQNAKNTCLPGKIFTRQTTYEKKHNTYNDHSVSLQNHKNIYNAHCVFIWFIIPYPTCMHITTIFWNIGNINKSAMSFVAY